MMSNSDLNDEIITDILRKGMQRISSPDFEDRVMARINGIPRQWKSIARSLKISWLFSALGFLMAVGLLVYIMLYSEAVFGAGIRNIVLYILPGILVAGILGLDQLRIIIKTKQINAGRLR